MSLANGRHYLAIPGPSVMPDRVLNAMHQPAPNIYTGALPDMVEALVPDLKAVARTRQHLATYITNGHGAWEAALTNVLCPGDRVLILATGRFAIGWGEVARRLGAEVETLDFGRRAAIDMDRLARRLEEDRAHEIRAVMAVQVDTATSVRNDVEALRATLDAAGHPALLMIDCIASLGCEVYEMDAWGVDVTVAGSQKGLMTPPGLGFVFFNDKADAARDRAPCASAYWDWRPREWPQHFYHRFGGTAPTHHLFALREALHMIAEEGLDAIWSRHAALARAIWAAAEAWGRDGPMELNLADVSIRSHAVTALRITAPLGTTLREWLTQNAGVTLGIGLGMAEPDDPAWHGFFRIGHMGHVNAQMIMGALGSIDAGLKALDIAHGPGALDAASAVLAEACGGSSQPG